MSNDIAELIIRFDQYLDDMYDRGSFDPIDEKDSELSNFLDEMKKKYSNEIKQFCHL